MPSAFTFVSRALGASAFVGESNFSLTPDTIRTVATASTATGLGPLLAGVGATPAAAAAAMSRTIMRCVTHLVHNGKRRIRDCSILDLISDTADGIARGKSLC